MCTRERRFNWWQRLGLKVLLHHAERHLYPTGVIYYQGTHGDYSWGFWVSDGEGYDGENASSLQSERDSELAADVAASHGGGS